MLSCRNDYSFEHGEVTGLPQKSSSSNALGRVATSVCTKRTTSRDEAERIISQVYARHRLVSARGARLDFELRSSSSSQVTIGRVRYGAKVSLEVPASGSDYHLVLPIRGCVFARSEAGEFVASSGRGIVILGPRNAHSVSLHPGTIAYAVKIDRLSLLAHARCLRGREHLQHLNFPLGFDLAHAAGQNTLATMRFLWEERQREGGLEGSPVLLTQLEQLLMTRLLTAIPNTVDEDVIAVQRRPRKKHIARVLEFIESHPHQPHSLAALSRIAMVGVRALQTGFQQELGMTPSGYVRMVRLDRVHAALLEAKPGESVTSIASHSGFTHMGRFSAQYKQRFGVSPSHTLLRREQLSA